MNSRAKLALSALTFALAATCHAQPVYSVGIHSGGVTYYQLCSFTSPFPPYYYELTERCWFTDTNGLVIIGIGGEKARGVVVHWALDIKCGTVSFSVPLQAVPPNTALEPTAAASSVLSVTNSPKAGSISTPASSGGGSAFGR